MSHPAPTLERRPALAKLMSQEDLLGTLQSINRDFLLLLADLAAQCPYKPIGAVQLLTAQLCALQPDTAECASRFPFLLLDLHFSDSAWWTAAKDQRAYGVSDSTSWPAAIHARSLSIARSTLMLAWHTARTERDVAMVILGLSASVTTFIAKLSLQDLDRIADAHCHAIRPRWEDSPGVWQQLVGGARGAPITAARAFVLHALQLISSDQVAVPAMSPNRALARPGTLSPTQSP